MKSKSRRAGHLYRVVWRHPKAALRTLIASMAVLLLVMLVWPGAVPVAVPIAGSLLACVLAVVVAWVLDRRHPFIRSREDVERYLELTVLATCPRGER